MVINRRFRFDLLRLSSDILILNSDQKSTAENGKSIVFSGQIHGGFSYLLGTMTSDGAKLGDKLILRGLMFHGYHGVKQEEKKLGQKFKIDVDAWMDLRMPGHTDNMSDTVSYTDIYRIVKNIVEGPSQNLLESVAQLIATN